MPEERPVSIRIDPMVPSDWDDIRRIYLDGIATGHATFERDGIWTLQAGIFPENAASLALHRRSGFREVGRRERLGRLRGVWRDVVLLERRSATVGSDCVSPSP